MHPLVGVFVAYLLGSIPAAFIAGKLRGIDLRDHGSGNLGATNVFRVLGARTGAIVMAFDLAKGALPVYFLPGLTGVELRGWWAIGYGIAAIIGHVRPVYLLWKGGGKGVATSAGVFLALTPIAMSVTTAIWIAVLLRSGYVSLASLVAALVLPVGVLIAEGFDSPLFYVSVLVAVFVVWTHRANIGRLRRGEESRFGGRKNAA
ncbi:MAG: glycerol-3-phosphate 1-O-acyltransferase PlsY [Gemmatimonadaceae bacterium]|nr:glycerol-3-phosphate 1-O-acyltransferase PlsY [Gemmatimonadaceae bacterium]MDQ3518739.1 glycerol-3-phosphate 1-O-acyltransferase PlsY [Gemmatimonadota bacterium]